MRAIEFDIDGMKVTLDQETGEVRCQDEEIRTWLEMVVAIQPVGPGSGDPMLATAEELVEAGDIEDFETVTDTDEQIIY